MPRPHPWSYGARRNVVLVFADDPGDVAARDRGEHLGRDVGGQGDRCAGEPEIVARLAALLERDRTDGRSAPRRGADRRRTVPI